MDASSVPNPSNVTFTTNRMQGVNIWGSPSLASDGLWKNWANNAPYVITGDVTVDDGVSLTVEPGTTVKFRDARLWINGVIIADGTPNRITFTSSRDDTIAGDTDGTNAVASASQWKGIYVSPNSGASVFNHCAFRYAGQKLDYINWSDRYTTLYLNSCSPLITNCVIGDSGGHGIEAYASTAVLRGNVFANLGDGAYAVVLDTIDLIPSMSGNSASGTGIPGIAIPGQTLGTNATWNKAGTNSPYFLNGEVTVAEGNRLTIDPGVTVKSANQRLLVYGTLRAVGTAAEPITFTSRNDPPKRSDWKGIYLSPKAGSSVMSFCTVTYAGANLGYINWADRFAAVYADQCSPRFNDLTIMHSGGYGMELYGSSALVQSSLVGSNAWSNFRLLGGRQPAVDQ